MATTTNYAWETPDDTDLVKDGAAAIRTLGSSVDTTTKALNPSTTLGDIEYRSATANTNTRLGIGTTGQVLSVSGGVPAWSTPPSGTWSQVATGSLTGTSVSITGLSGKQFFVILEDWSHNSASSEPLNFRLNNDSGSNYITAELAARNTWGNLAGNVSGTNNYDVSFFVDLADTASQFKPVIVTAGTENKGANYISTSAITSIQVSTDNFSGVVSFDGGTYYVWAFN